MSESCRHIAALLLRVKDAIANGQTGSSCTSSASTWVLPVKSTVPVLGEVSTFDFIQPYVTSESKWQNPTKLLLLDLLSDCKSKSILNADTINAIVFSFRNVIWITMGGKYRIYLCVLSQVYCLNLPL